MKEHLACGGDLVYSYVSGGGTGYRCKKCGWEHSKGRSKMKNRKEVKAVWKRKDSRGEKISWNQNQKGVAIAGKLLEVRDTDFAVKGYTLEMLNGEKVSFLGTSVLDRLLCDEQGSYVRIKYLGIESLGEGKTLKRFEVDIWEGEDFVGIEDK